MTKHPELPRQEVSMTTPLINYALTALPPSALARESDTLRIFLLLQSFGLNRETKREMASRFKKLQVKPELAPLGLKEIDTKLLGVYIDGGTRATRFWQAFDRIGRLGLRRAEPSIQMSPEMAMLVAFDRDFLSTALDESWLRSVLPEWDTLRALAFSGLPEGTVAKRVGIMSSWRRIHDALGNWTALDDTKRAATAEAVFAVSAALGGNALIRCTVSRFSVLEAILGRFCSTDSVAGSGGPTTDDSNECEPDRCASDEIEWEDSWRSTVDRLIDLARSLHDQRSQDAVAEVRGIASELDLLIASAPPPLGAEIERIRGRIDEHISNLRTLSEEELFRWLDNDTLLQLRARWDTAIAEVGSVEEATKATDDLDRAMRVSHDAAAAHRRVHERLQRSRDALTALEAQIAKENSLAKRRPLQLDKSRLKADEAACEQKVLDSELEFLSASSPRGDAFDFDTDYTAQPYSLTAREPTQPVPTEADPPLKAQETAEPVDSGATEPQIAKDRVEKIESRPSSDPVRAIQAHANTDTPAEDPLEACDPEPRETHDASASANHHPEPEVRIEPTGFDDSAGNRCAPIWNALELRRPTIAYWLTSAIAECDSPPSLIPLPLLRAVSLADHLVLPDGVIADALDPVFSGFQEGWFISGNDVPTSWTVSLNLLLVAATLKPLLLAPASGAAAAAEMLHLDSAHGALHDIHQAIREFVDRSQGFRIESASFKVSRDRSLWQADLDALIDETADWLKQAPSMTMLYAPATKVWQTWMKPGQLIADLLDPIVSRQLHRVEDLKRAVAALSMAGAMEHQITHTDRKIIGRRKGENIQARALSQMLSRVGEPILLARRWIALVEGRPESSDRLSRLIDDLRMKLVPLRQRALGQLDAPVDGDSWRLVPAARTVVRATLNHLDRLLDPEVPSRTNEPSPAQALGTDLLLAADIDVGLDWRPQQSGETLEAALRNLLAAPIDAVRAFESHVAKGDLSNARLLLSTFSDLFGPTDLERHELALEAELSHLRDIRERRISHVRTDIDTSLAYGLFSEAERAAHESELVTLEAHRDTVLDFRPGDVVLDNIASIVDERRKQKTDAARARLHQLKTRDRSPSQIAVIDEAIATGDILSANEYLQRLELGEQIPDAPHQVSDRFSGFFPSVANRIDTYLESVQPSELIRTFQNAGPGVLVAGASLAELSDLQREQARELLEAWYSIKSKHRADRDHLRQLLGAAGFGVLDLTIQGQSAVGRQDYLMRCTSIEDRAICPIPHFGSLASGHYRVICLWPRPAEEDIVKLVGDTSVAAPTVVLYFGRLNERKRREASRLARVHQRSFLLIDETLALLLGIEPGSGLAHLFDAALPFAYSLPYDATSSVVPTEMFYGRQDELQAVQGLNGRCFIYGGRQLGKTALLRKSEKTFHLPSEQRFAKWIDLRAEGIGVNRVPAEIWSTLARELKQLGALKGDIVDPNPNIKGRIDRFLDALRETISTHTNMRVLLLLDEADRFFEQDGQQDFLETRRLKELMESSQRRFKVVFAGLHNVLRTTVQANHPLAHLGEAIKIGPLIEGQEWRDAEDLIVRPFAAAGFEFESRTLVTRILAQTNYYPSLIQLYCSHLMRQMLDAVRRDVRLSGPRYAITAKHVDTVYRSHALREEIRSKFQLTLQLDPRYEVVAYSLAHDALSERVSGAMGRSTSEISESARSWWRDGFAGTTEAVFRVLLDEMVGLGVLRQTQEGKYWLRNPNILLLLGNLEEVEGVLLRDRELPLEFEPDAFRSRLTGVEPTNPRRHPLTFQQRKVLGQRRSAVTIVSGNRAAGVDDLIEFLQADRDTERLTIANDIVERRSFKQRLEKVIAGREAGRTLMVVPHTLPWDRTWVEDSQAATSKLASKDKTLHVLFVADPDLTLALLRGATVTSLKDVAWLSMTPWKDVFVRQWLVDMNRPSEPEHRKELHGKSGFWPQMLIDREASVSRGVFAKTSAKQAQVRSSLDEQSLFGISDPTVATVLRTLAEHAEPLALTDLSLLSEHEPDAVEVVIAWGERLGLVARTSDDLLELDSYLSSILIGSSADPA
jgi:hypothetical protein